MQPPSDWGKDMEDLACLSVKNVFTFFAVRCSFKF